MGLPERFVEQVRLRGSLEAGDRVIVACSGGADSVALAHLLAGARDELGLDGLALAHLDHALRPRSEEDAAFVADLGAALELPTTIERRAVDRAPGESPEAAARRVRYGFLADAARALGATVVATAHHLDDQAETVLLRVLTGTGPSGLRGVRPARPLPGAGGVRIVRPLLDLRAAELRAFLKGSGLTWREDPTNQRGNLRARLRAEALPLLDRVAGRDVAPLLARLADNVQDESPDAGEFSRVAASFVVASDAAVRLAPGWERLPDRVLVPGLRGAVQSLRADPSPPSRDEVLRVLAAARGNAGDTISRLVVSRVPEGGVEITCDAGEGCPQPPIEPRELPVPGEVVWPGSGRALTARTGPLDAGCVLRRLCAPEHTLALLDADRCGSMLRVRAIEAGDRFVPLGAEHAARVRHFLQRRGVPAARRSAVPLVTDPDGILWVAGVGIAHRARLRPGTTRVLELQLRTD